MSSSSLLHKRPDISYRSIGTFFSFIQFLTVNTFVNSYRKSKVAFPQQLHSYFNLDHQTRFIMAPLGNFLSVKRYTLHRFMQFMLSVYMCVCVCVCVCTSTSCPQLAFIQGKQWATSLLLIANFSIFYHNNHNNNNTHMHIQNSRFLPLTSAKWKACKNSDSHCTERRQSGSCVHSA